MRKRLLTPIPQGIQSQEEGWLDLDRAASVEVTSEEKGLRDRSCASLRKNAGDPSMHVPPSPFTLEL